MSTSTRLRTLTLFIAADAVAEDSVEVAAVVVEAAAAVVVSEDETRKLPEWTQNIALFSLLLLVRLFAD